MKLTIERDALAKALAHVAGAAEKKTTVPILATIKLVARGDAITATATDMDIEASARASAAVEGDGATAVFAETLVGFIKKLPAGASIALETDDANATLTIKSGRARLSLPALPASDFPEFPRPVDATRFTIGAPELRRLIDKTRFAASSDQSRYYLNGVFFHARERNGDKRLAAVATDGHRLAYADTDRPSFDGAMPDVIVPKQAIGELRKMIADHDGDVEISATPKLIAAEAGDFTLIAKAIDGSFPEYQRVVPASLTIKVPLDRQAMTEALARVLIVADDDARSVKLSSEGETLTLSARTPDRGEARDDMSLAEAAEVALRFNGRYLAEALTHAEGERVSLRLSDPGSPTILEDENDPHAFVVLMPLRV